MYTPMNIAIGMVAITVNMPHGLSARALTTISASTARMMIMIRKQPNRAMVPGMRPISSRTMSPSERPLRRVEEQDHEVLHRTGQHNAGDQPQRTGQVAHLRGEDRADKGPAPAMAAKWWPKRMCLLVGT